VLIHPALKLYRGQGAGAELRLARPAVLVDINGLDELSGVSVTDGQVMVGAMTREYMAEESETVAATLPLLASALPLIGHEAIRSRGTLGGSMAHADPAAELPAVARALDAEFVVRSQSGERVIPAVERFEGYPGDPPCLPPGQPFPQRVPQLPATPRRRWSRAPARRSRPVERHGGIHLRHASIIAAQRTARQRPDRRTSRINSLRPYSTVMGSPRRTGPPEMTSA
jgi:hypothetical protein